MSKPYWWFDCPPLYEPIKCYFISIVSKWDPSKKHLFPLTDSWSTKSCWKWGYNREWLKICVFVWVYVYTVCVCVFLCVSKNVNFQILKFEIKWCQRNHATIVTEIPARVEAVGKKIFWQHNLALWVQLSLNRALPLCCLEDSKVLDQLILCAKRISCLWPFTVDGFPCDTVWLACVENSGGEIYDKES